MNYNISFDIAALFIMIILVLISFIRKNVLSTKIEVYKGMAVIHLIAIIFDIFTISTITEPQTHSMVYNYLINLGYYAFHNVTIFMFFMYGIVSEPFVPHRNTVIKVSKIIAFLVYFFILTTPYTKLVFYFDDNLVYSHGPILYFLYAVSVFVVGYVAYLKILNRKYHSGFVLVTNICYTFALLGTFIINIINGYLLIELFVITVGFFVIYLAQDNPESYLYKNLNIYNRKAFEEKMIGKSNFKEKFDVVIFTPADRSNLDNMDRNDLFVIERYIVEKCIEELKCYYSLYVLDNLTFAIIVKKDLNRYIDTINNIFTNANPVNLKVVNLSMSIGLMSYPNQVSTYDEIIVTVDEMIKRLRNYASKEILVVEKSFIESQDDKGINEAIKKAITSNTFIIRYEPIFNSKYNISLDAEARISINYNETELSYETLFPYANKSGLIIDLDKSALLRINEFIKKTDVFAFGINTIGINISSAYLIEKDFYKTLIDFAKENDILAERICFELSNSEIIIDNESFVENLFKLKEYGFHFALDKFGESPVSFSSLLKLPIDVIKVDKKLLSLATDDQCKKFVSSIFDMIKSANIHTACEGITDKQLYNYALSDDCGCEYYQGDYVSISLEEKEYTKFVKEQLRQSLEMLGMK